jgi:internalin A
MTQEVIQIIEQAARDRVMRLDLSLNRLTTLPPEIGQLTSLTQLDLRNNQLTTLPSEIGQLTSLTRLNLSFNQLVTLPSEIGQLLCMTQLYLRSNGLTALPPEIGQLTHMMQLDLSENRLTTLPPEIGQLTRLVQLNLGYNQLTTLPPEIGQLPRLVQLNLSYNQLTTLPLEIGQLTNLTQLYLENNWLTTLPPEIGQLPHLKVLRLEGSLLPVPPEILEKANEPTIIINYYLQHLPAQKKPLNEAKVLLVGQGGVGKTSLVRRLVEGRFDPHENKTEGIDIRRWAVTVDEQEIRLNVWDFGGQEIMHATHQFFLTRRSLYLLVLDARLDEEENRLEYWLKIIQSFGGDSPIIIVGNKVDQQALDLDRRGLQAKYPSIRAFVETSCVTGAGIDELEAIITCEIGQLKHVHDQLLNTWFGVKTQLENMEQDYIPYEEYTRLCQAGGVTDDLSQRTLIGFLHDLGVVLNFQDDPRLEETNVLNPEWVTNGVYKILNDPALSQSKGVLKRETLNQVLESSAYPRHKHLFIVDMMRKFELCFDFEGRRDQKFLIPDLLSKEEPESGDWDAALAFQYHYNVLPSSVISRFIVRMNHYVHRDVYWRSGVVLEYDGNRALVKADREDKKIFIRVAGPERGQRTFLTVIRSHFDAIHGTITGIEAEEKVPLPGHPEIVVSYEHLQTLERLRKDSFVPEGATQEFSVRQLLDGVDERDQRRKYLIHLRRVFTERFDESELQTLCFDLGVEYEGLRGERYVDRVRELLTYLGRRRRLPELVQHGKQARPDIDWDDYSGLPGEG